MIIVMGATGQVGSEITKQLLAGGQAVKAVARNAEKAAALKKAGAEIVIADAFDDKLLKKAFEGGTVAFLLTPETGKSDDVIGDTKRLLENYKNAVQSARIQKIVGLSSMGAQLEGDTGNLKMSYMLEHAFADMDVQQIFIRPSYYYSNWLMQLSSIKESGVLPTFYPPDLKIPMSSPMDIAGFAAGKLVQDVDDSPVYEVLGPQWYSSAEIANIFGEVLGKKVKAQQVPKEEWPSTIKSFGFTDDAVKNFIKMTQTVVDGKSKPQGGDTITISVPTTFKDYLEKQMDKEKS